jgi:hypothetical protein
MAAKDTRYGLGQIVSSNGAPPGSIKARLASLRGIADTATKAPNTARPPHTNGPSPLWARSDSRAVD